MRTLRNLLISLALIVGVAVPTALVTMHVQDAQAISGPWRKVRHSDIEPCSTWFVRPLDETDITGSVEWSTNLPDKVRFGTVKSHARGGLQVDPVRSTRRVRINSNYDFSYRSN